MYRAPQSITLLPDLTFMLTNKPPRLCFIAANRCFHSTAVRLNQLHVGCNAFDSLFDSRAPPCLLRIKQQPTEPPSKGTEKSTLKPVC
mmetsp:Transcript_23942/g.59418  ORF Transcript_23942/g.59418 Transcript_23942/m.59418 type:complete len:88 (-) Transcript_23942:198-461(-)